MKASPNTSLSPSPYQSPSLPRVSAYSLLSLLNDAFEHIVQSMGGSILGPYVTICENPLHGDFTSNIALRLAHELKKSPMDIALQVKNILESGKESLLANQIDHNTSIHDSNISERNRGNTVLQDVKDIKIAAPGFVNLILHDSAISNQIKRLIDSNNPVLTVYREQTAGNRVILEFTDPNPFKELHIGHLYSNSVGESLARLLIASGFEVKRVCYQGDVGLHVAKAIWGMQKLLLGDVSSVSTEALSIKLSEIDKFSMSEKAKWLGKAYALGSQAYEEDTVIADGIKDINYAVFIAAQQNLQEKSDWKAIIDYQQYRTNTSDISWVKLLYTIGRKWSLDYFDSIYKRLGMMFDGFYFESTAGEYGASIVKQHTPGIFINHEGAVIFQGEAYGLHTRVFMNALGLPTYEAKELGLAPTKYGDWPYDYSLILTGKEIDEYFQVLLTVMACIQPDLANRTKHLSHGMVRLPEGKMSSRTGNVLTGEWLIEEVKGHIYNIVQNNISKYKNSNTNNSLDNNNILNDTYNPHEIAEKAAIAAIKYSLLRVGLPADITFDIQASISFEGESGPYLQYTYARCRSVLRKYVYNEESADLLTEVTLNGEERSLAFELLQFSDVVSEATNLLSPNVLCTYLFHLAQTFNLFYGRHTIGEHPVRLALTQATARVMAEGLRLLGIETMERM